MSAGHRPSRALLRSSFALVISVVASFHFSGTVSAHARESGHPVLGLWVPAFAGMGDDENHPIAAGLWFRSCTQPLSFPRRVAPGFGPFGSPACQRSEGDGAPVGAAFLVSARFSRSAAPSGAPSRRFHCCVGPRFAWAARLSFGSGAGFPLSGKRPP